MDHKLMQQGQVEAWTYLLRRHTALREARVLSVESQPLTEQEARYHLTLAGQSEPITLIGRETNITEARFYQTLSEVVSDLIPRCWLAVEEPLTNTGWVVLEDITHHHPPRTWDLSDIERLGSSLAHLHATFWGMSRSRADWLPLKPDVALQDTAAAGSFDLFDPFFRTGSANIAHGYQATPPAIKSTLNSRLASPSQIAALHRQRPELLSNSDVEILLTLLDHPELMIRPLLSMPFTLLHGNPLLSNWRLTLFDECYLLNWQKVAAGPAALDLAQLLIQVLSLYKTIGLGDNFQENEIEELLIDSYFFHLSRELHEIYGYKVTYSSRYIRRFALPAAQCWHMFQLLRQVKGPAESEENAPWQTILPGLLHACKLLTIL